MISLFEIQKLNSYFIWTPKSIVNKFVNEFRKVFSREYFLDFVFSFNTQDLKIF